MWAWKDVHNIAVFSICFPWYFTHLNGLKHFFIADANPLLHKYNIVCSQKLFSLTFSYLFIVLKVY
jgi:hypothetical protein